jgi:hypothetical protein
MEVCSYASDRTDAEWEAAGAADHPAAIPLKLAEFCFNSR